MSFEGIAVLLTPMEMERGASNCDGDSNTKESLRSVSIDWYMRIVVDAVIMRHAGAPYTRKKN